MKENKNDFIFQFRLWFYNKRYKLKRNWLLRKVIAFSKTAEGVSFHLEGLYLKENGLKIFPYEFEKKYKTEDIEIIYKDHYPYFTYFGKSLFLPKEFTEAKCKKYGSQILLEQDKESSHCYSTPLFNVDKDDVLLDIGCADGNFALAHIDVVKEVFLFELDTKWEKPLEFTFKPWKDKVHVSFQRLKKSDDLKFLGKLTSENSRNVVLKIDVDGAEREVLSLLDPLIPTLKSVKVAICTYHQGSDALDFEKWFLDRGFKTEFSPNYMLFYHDKKINRPFFRRGILFAVKG